MYSKEELMEHGDEISLVMMMNRMQSAEDIEEFRTISPERIDSILENTPEYRRERMADILKAFLLKINVPTEEAEELVSKVKEKEMGELFANIDKMDIQEERRKTAEVRRELEEVRKQLAEKEKEMGELFANIDKIDIQEERRKTAEARRELEEIREQSEEDIIQSIIQVYKECGISREETTKKVIDKFGLDIELAEEKMFLYWNRKNKSQNAGADANEKYQD